MLKGATDHVPSLSQWAKTHRVMGVSWSWENLYLRPVVIKVRPLETIPNFNPQFFLSLNLLLLPHPQGRPQAGVEGCG